MYHLETLRLPDELHYRSLISRHPGLIALRNKLGQEWEVYAQAHTLPAGTRGGSIVSMVQGSELWTATADVLARFGVYRRMEVSVSDASAHSLEGCRYAQDAERVRLCIPSGILSLLAGDELRAGVAHILGHCLLGHTDANDVNTVVTVASSPDPHVSEALRTDPSIASVLRLARVLSQLQELSADRAALIGTRDFDAVAAVVLKLTYGRSSTLVNFDDALRLIEPVQNDPLWIERNHPYGPNRLLALVLAGQVELQSTWSPDDPLSRLLPKLVPLVDGGEYTKKTAESESERIDRHLLEMFLIDTVAVTNPLWDTVAERLINELIPASYYEKVMSRFDRLSNDADTEEELLISWLKKASRRPVAWKRSIIERLLHEFGTATPTSDEALVRVSWLARAIDAPIHPTEFAASATFARRTVELAAVRKASVGRKTSVAAVPLGTM